MLCKRFSKCDVCDGHDLRKIKYEIKLPNSAHSRASELKSALNRSIRYRSC